MPEDRIWAQAGDGRGMLTQTREGNRRLPERQVHSADGKYSYSCDQRDRHQEVWRSCHPQRVGVQGQRSRVPIRRDQPLPVISGIRAKSIRRRQSTRCNRRRYPQCSRGRKRADRPSSQHTAKARGSTPRAALSRNGSWVRETAEPILAVPSSLPPHRRYSLCEEVDR